MLGFTGFRRNLGLFLAVAVTFSLVSTSPAHADSKIYRQALSSTVWILSKAGGETSSGTGVLIDSQRKLIVTTYHVVGESPSAVVFFPEMKDGKPNVSREFYAESLQTLGIRAQVISADKKRDLALLQLDRLPANVRPVRFATTSAGPGDAVESVGNPGSTDALWVYTSGTVRSIYKKQFRTAVGDHDFTVVETQSPINTGDSGGPMFNAAGELVAISQSISPNARLVSYAVDIGELREFLASPLKPTTPAVPAAPPTTNYVMAKPEAPKPAVGPTEIKVDVSGGTQQSVFIGKDLETYEKVGYRKVWALAGTLSQPPKPELALKLLDQNGQTKLGSWAVERTAKGEFLVLFCAKIDAGASPEAVKSTVEYVAKVSTLMRNDLNPTETRTQQVSDSLSGWVK
jgi:serine protease Do